MALSIGLAVVNYQHWDAYRQFARSIQSEVEHRRVWINGEWGLRYYLESEGALAMPNGQALKPGEMVVTSDLALPLETRARRSRRLRSGEIRPVICRCELFRSTAARRIRTHRTRGLLPFENFDAGRSDRIHEAIVVERRPQLTSLDPTDPNAASQIVAGIYAPDKWMGEEATVVLKRPEQRDARCVVAIFILPDSAPARHLKMLVDGQLVAEENIFSESWRLCIRPWLARRAIPRRKTSR